MRNESDVSTGFEDLVVIGSSAGGVEALTVLVGALREDFPAPIVLAQHLDPKRPSQLAPMLERHSRLPVEMVQESSRLKPGTVYVVPSNRHVSVEDGSVRLEADHATRPRPSVDLLLSSAAHWYGERLVAVILTGYGSDGAAGAVEVKNAGGTVIIQNPETAQFPAMPLALPPTAVDHIADLEHIPQLLYDILTDALMPEGAEGDQKALADIFKMVSRQADIDFTHYKTPTIVRRIGRRMAATHTRSLRDYAGYLETQPDEIGELVMAFLIRVTEFFRDAEAFEYLGKHVVPELVERGRETGRVLRLWSAGCATGEEPYSLALLVADHLGAELPEWSIKIFATDIDERAIEFARRGLYPTSTLKNIPEPLKAQFFERANEGMRISKTLRQMVIFGQQDLSRRVPFPRIDLIVCRNLLIYFKPELQQRILNSFVYSLSKGGYLFLGKAETARPSIAAFELVEKRWKVYRCDDCPTGARYAQQPYQPRVPGDRGGAAGRLETNGDRQHALEARLPESNLAQVRRFNDLVLRLLPVGVVIIDRSYRIVTISGAARRLLGIRDAGVDLDFLHAVRGLPYARVRAAIDGLFQDRLAVTLPEIELDTAVGGDGRYLLLNAVLVQVEVGTAELAIISVTDITDHVQTRRRLEAAQSEQSQLMEEINAANKRLGEMNKDLQDANEELQAANEELMLTQEELQATNEEFEATNEELQATNEELETNNEELQATNEELEATNDELGARSHDLQHLAGRLQAKQVLLDTIVEQAPIAIVALRGPDLLVEKCNSKFASLLDADPVGRPFEEVFGGSESEDFLALVRDAYRRGVAQTAPRIRSSRRARDEGDTDRVLTYTVVPTHDGPDHIDGLIVYAEEISALPS